VPSRSRRTQGHIWAILAGDVIAAVDGAAANSTKITIRVFGPGPKLRYGIYLQSYLEETSYGQIHPSSVAYRGIQREQDRGGQLLHQRRNDQICGAKRTESRSVIDPVHRR
jgi:hypothetical protein